VTKPKVELDLQGKEFFEKYVAHIELNQSLDSPAKLKVDITHPQNKWKDTSASSLPSEASFSCGGRGLFKGSLLSSEAISTSVVRLTFMDDLGHASKMFESEFIKEQRLEDYIRWVCGLVKLSPKFIGPFSEMLPGTNITGKSFLEHLTELSSQYGFHFVCRSFSKELLFIRVGKHNESVNVDVYESEDVLAFTHRTSVSSVYSSGEVRFFDTHRGQSDKKEVAMTSLYEPLGFLKSHSGFSARNKWAHASGRMEVVATDLDHFNNGDRSLQFELSKRALDQEAIHVRCLAPLALPGDKIDIKGGALPYEDGEYLARDIRVEVASALPIIEITGVRA
jgi:hypothetical protein